MGTVSLSAEQIAASKSNLTGLTTGTAYTVELLRDDAVRKWRVSSRRTRSTSM
ncbi:MAG: hypothetical protein V8Q54_11350 [Alistipes senegalensis]